jgi:hypothetical protein
MASASYQHAQDLVRGFPDAAICLIVAACDYRDIVETLTQARYQSHRETPSAGANYKSIEPAPPTSPGDSQQSVSPPNNQRFRPQTPQTNRSAFPPSPAPTPSTGKSPLPKSNVEYVVVIADGPADDQVKEYKLSMRIAPVLCSLIREDIVRTRLCSGASVKFVPNAPISIECPATPSGSLLSSHQVTLTWRRTTSHKTHETLFYLVPDKINVDILLSYSDSGGGSSYITCKIHTQMLD